MNNRPSLLQYQVTFGYSTVGHNASNFVHGATKHQMPLLSLPTECLWRIVEYSSVIDLVRLRQVSMLLRPASFLWIVLQIMACKS